MEVSIETYAPHNINTNGSTQNQQGKTNIPNIIFQSENIQSIVAQFVIPEDVQSSELSDQSGHTKLHEIGLLLDQFENSEICSEDEKGAITACKNAITSGKEIEKYQENFKTMFDAINNEFNVLKKKNLKNFQGDVNQFIEYLNTKGGTGTGQKFEEEINKIAQFYNYHKPDGNLLEKIKFLTGQNSQQENGFIQNVFLASFAMWICNKDNNSIFAKIEHLEKCQRIVIPTGGHTKQCGYVIIEKIDDGYCIGEINSSGKQRNTYLPGDVSAIKEAPISSEESTIFYRNGDIDYVEWHRFITDIFAQRADISINREVNIANVIKACEEMDSFGRIWRNQAEPQPRFSRDTFDDGCEYAMKSEDKLVYEQAFAYFKTRCPDNEKAAVSAAHKFYRKFIIACKYEFLNEFYSQIKDNLTEQNLVLLQYGQARLANDIQKYVHRLDRYNLVIRQAKVDSLQPTKDTQFQEYLDRIDILSQQILVTLNEPKNIDLLHKAQEYNSKISGLTGDAKVSA